MQNNLPLAADDIVDVTPVSEDVRVDAAATDTKGLLRGFNLGRRFRVSHLRTFAKDGWGHDESNGVTAKSLLALSSMYQGNFHSGYRLVIGNHTFWIIRT